MTSLHFFATRTDLEPGIRRIESLVTLKYAVCGLFPSARVDVYASLLDVPDLGINTTGDHVTGNRYLVLHSDQEVQVEAVTQRNGGVLYAVDQKLNPGTTTILPGGLFENRCLICGHIETIAEDEIGRDLQRTFAAALTKGFKKVRSYRLGPEALRLAEGGLRLVTGSVESSSEYDLSV